MDVSPSTDRRLEISEILEDDDDDPWDALLDSRGIPENTADEDDVLRMLDDLVVSQNNQDDHVDPATILPTEADTIHPTSTMSSTLEDLMVSPIVARNKITGMEESNAVVSPTTFLDSLLSTRTEKNMLEEDPIRSLMIDTAPEFAHSKLPPKPPLSTEPVGGLSALHQQQQKVMPTVVAVAEHQDTSTARSDQEVLPDASSRDASPPPSGMLDNSLFVIDDDEEDGMDSFMTAAMEDASSSIVSKTSTGAGTRSASAEEPPAEEGPSSMFLFPAAEATVSFCLPLAHVAATDARLALLAPLPLEEDPTTPKRSGREPLVLLERDDRHVLESGGLSQVGADVAPAPLGERMGPAERDMRSGNIDRKGDVLRDVVLSNIAPLPLSSSDHEKSQSEAMLELSVPSLADDAPVETPAKSVQSERRDFTVVSLDDKAHSPEDVGSGGHAPDVALEPMAPRVLEKEIIHHILQEKNDSSAPKEVTLDVALSREPSLDVGPTGVRLNHEIKSLLQVEFPSVLESGNKKSDVSLSSASSTISHGSYSKARASYVAAPSKTEEMQKRRHHSTDSLPPRSPPSRNDPNDPANSRAFAASVSKKLQSEAVTSGETDLERVESKWIKQSLAINFNPKKSIFAGKRNKKNSTDSISSPGSPPEPWLESDSDSEFDSSNDGSSNSSTISDDMGHKAIGLWDMMGEDGLWMDQNDLNPSQYVVSVESKSPNLVPAAGRADDSVTASSIAPSENEVRKNSKLSTKPSFKSDASLSSSAVKGRSTNIALSFSQHSRGSLCSGRSRDGRQGSRNSKSFISPVGKSGPVKSVTRLEADSVSLGRFTLKDAKSPDRTTLPTAHCSSPDLYRLHEEPSQSQQPTPIKVSCPDSGFDLSDGSDRIFIADALPSDTLSPEPLVEMYANLVNEAKLGEQDAGILQEELLLLSSIQPLDLPFRYSYSFAPLKYIGSLLWRQLIACWKHAEITRTMMTCARFSHMEETTIINGHDRAMKHSMTSSHRGRQSFDDLELNGVHIQPRSTRPDTGVFKGFNVDKRDYSLSMFLTRLTLEPAGASRGVLRHDVSTSGSDKVKVEDLLEIAEKSLPELTLLVKDIIAFSSLNISSTQDTDVMPFSVGTKDVDSIIRKAQRKYEGDLLQVKDILRAQILFPSEGGLICGLVRLSQAMESSNTDSDSGYLGISLARIKNLFAGDSCLGTLLPSSLPTGYRHVLLNIRLKCGLLVELQFNILHLFNALGHEGYMLHRELNDLRHALSEREKASRSIRGWDIKIVVDEAINCNLSRCKSEPLLNELEATSAEFLVSTDNSPEVSAESYNEINNLSWEAKTKHLHSIAQDIHSVFTGGDIILAILDHGTVAASQKPRDVSVFYCLYIFFVFLLNRESDETITKVGFGVKSASSLIEFARQCLLRCLMISNEIMSDGMTGWLEYGASSTLDRISELPFSILRHLLYVYGRQDKWTDAESVCRALLIRCEHHLPAYHPIALTSLIDLALISSIVGNRTFAQKALSRAAERLSRYLTTMESMYIKHVTKARPSGKAGKTVVNIEHGRDACFMLQTFVSHFQKQLHREMVSLVDADNYIILTNHCFVADSLAVLANCISSSKFFLGAESAPCENQGLQYWQMAYKHYERAFNGFVKTRKSDDPAVSRAAYGLARCLREFGKTDKAIQLLSLVVSFKEDRAVEATKAAGSNVQQMPSLRFLPVTASLKAVGDKMLTPKLLSRALCLWLMAILSIDRSRNEEGRERAFGYLHAASVALQASLNDVSQTGNESTRAICIRFLAMIEDEAEQIAEPIYE